METTKKKFRGFCADCGKKVGERRVYCDECRRKHRRENEKKDYYFYQKMGVCPKCKHRKIEDGKWGCPVCLEKARIRARKRKEKEKVSE